MRVVKRVAERTGATVGTLLMNAPLKAVEVSRTGCLLESRFPIEAGTAGRLRLAIAGRTYSEDVRITRCQRLEGSGAGYRLGVEFLRTRRPSASSLRRALYSMLDARDEGVFADESKVV